MRKPLHVAMSEASNTHKKRCLREFLQIGLTEGQPKVLSHLLVKEGILQKELAQRCRVEPATMTSLLRKMEAQKLIRKEEIHVSGGKRAYSIYLTDYGRETGKKALSIIDEMEEQSYRGFSEEEIDQLISMLDRIIKNINEIG